MMPDKRMTLRREREHDVVLAEVNNEGKDMQLSSLNSLDSDGTEERVRKTGKLEEVGGVTEVEVKQQCQL